MDWFGNWFNINTKSTAGLIDSLLRLINPVYAASAGATGMLKDAAKKWYGTYVELQKIPDASLSKILYQDKVSLLKRGKSIMDKIRIMGLSADKLQAQLGAVPLLAVGVVLSAAGLMLYWTYDFIKFKDKLAEYRAARKSGASVGEATAIIRELETPGFLAGVNKLAKFGLYAGGFLVAYKFAQSFGKVR